MTGYIVLNIWILSKVIYWLSILSILSETVAVVDSRQYLYVEVAIDSADCSVGVEWETQQQVVYTILEKHSELGLSGGGTYCGCSGPPPKPVCNDSPNKAEVKLLYYSSSGKVEANEHTLDSLKSLLGHGNIALQVVKGNVSSYYVCSNLTVITEHSEEYTNCITYKEPGGSRPAFTNPTSGSGASGSAGKPGTATIIGAVVGALAGVGLLAALAWAILRHIKRHQQVDDTGTNSDISPIIPGADGFGEAPNSVPPAGTS